METTKEQNGPQRRASGRIRLRTEDDISTWVATNRPLNGLPPATTEPEQETHVHFVEKKENNESESSSDSESEDSDDVQPVALDGGYAWFIVFISFVIHFICDGVSFSFGILFPEIQTIFTSSKFEASIVASLFLALPLLAGPIAGTFTDIYDCRAATIVGGLLATGGVVLAYIGPRTIIWFGMTFGVIAALGLCFCYNSGIVVVTYYFERRRALATALAVSGSGAGTAVFPILMETALSGFSFWGTILALSGFFFILVVIGLVMRDVEWPNETTEWKKKKFIRRMDKLRDDIESMRNCDMGFNALYPTREPIQIIRRALSLPVIPSYADDFLRRIEPSASIQSVRNAVSSLQDPVARSKSFGAFRTPEVRHLAPVPESQPLPDCNLEHLDLEVSSHSPYATVNSRMRVRIYSKCSMSVDALDLADAGLHNGDESSSDSELSNDGDSSSSELSDKILVKKPVQQKEVVFEQPAPNGTPAIVAVPNGPVVVQRKQNASPFTLPASARAVRSSMGGYTHSRVPASNAVGLRYFAMREPLFRGLQSKIPSAPALCVKKKKKKTLREVLHLKQLKATVWETAEEYWRLAQSARFTIFLLSILILYMFYDIPYVNFPEYTAEHLGYPVNETSGLIAGVGFFNMISMILCGIVCDLPWARDRLFLIYGVMTACVGLCVVASTVAINFLMMRIICCLYGFFIAANYVLASVILCQLLHVSDFQNGYGFLCLVEGVGNLIGPALVGWVRDTTNSYIAMFLVGGIGMTLSGLMVVFLHFTMHGTGSDTSSSENSPTAGRRRSSMRSNNNDSAAQGLLDKKETNGSAEP